jgi:hypothetical protein
MRCANGDHRRAAGVNGLDDFGVVDALQVAFCVPIIPGKGETDRKGFEEAAEPRRDEYHASRRRAGITCEMVWHQATPNGTVAVVYLEADDIPAAMQAMATSDDPFD